MKGYLYKEWKQNRILFLLTVIVAIFVAFLPILLVMAWENNVSKDVFLIYAYKGMLWQLLCVSLGFCLSLGIQEFALRDDDRRSWGYFVASSPKGVGGYVLTKYLVIGLMCLLFFTVSAGGDYIFTIVAKKVGGIDIPAITEALAMFFMLQLLIQAVDIPFGIRFGVKKGNAIKIILFLSLFVIFVLIFILNPEGVADLVAQIDTEGLKGINIKWALPVVSVMAYIFSYMISCKLYLKGVNEAYK